MTTDNPRPSLLTNAAEQLTGPIRAHARALAAASVLGGAALFALTLTLAAGQPQPVGRAAVAVLVATSLIISTLISYLALFIVWNTKQEIRRRRPAAPAAAPSPPRPPAKRKAKRPRRRRRR